MNLHQPTDAPKVPGPVETILSEVPDSTQPVVLLVRHSDRPALTAGDVGVKVPLTDPGRERAHRLGELLGDRLVSLHSSYMVRCQQTAQCMRSGAGQPNLPIAQEPLIGGHKAHVTHKESAVASLQEQGILNVIDLLCTDNPPAGFGDPKTLTWQLVSRMLQAAGEEPGVHAFTTHDSTVVITLSHLLNAAATRSMWPVFLEGAFLWRTADRLHIAYRDVRTSLSAQAITG